MKDALVASFSVGVGVLIGIYTVGYDLRQNVRQYMRHLGLSREDIRWVLYGHGGPREDELSGPGE